MGGTFSRMAAMPHPLIDGLGTVCRSFATGTVHAVTGGAIGGPTVLLTGTALWSLPKERSWSLRLKTLSLKRGYMGEADPVRLRRWIAEGGKGQHDLIAFDASQNAALGSALWPLLEQGAVSGLYGYELAAGGHNPAGAASPTAPVRIGTRFLPGFFDGLVSRTRPAEARHGAPYDEGRVVVSFAAFEGSDDPASSRLSAKDVQSTLSAATRLLAKTQDADGSTLELDASESVAAALMLLLYASAQFPPSAHYTPASKRTSWDKPLDYSPPFAVS